MAIETYTYRSAHNRLVRNEGIVKRMGVLGMENMGAPWGRCVYSAVQVFFAGEMQGQVGPHEEDRDVDEIYFPLTGSFEARRGDEIHTLTGNLNPSVLPGSSYAITYDEGQNLSLIHI